MQEIGRPGTPISPETRGILAIQQEMDWVRSQQRITAEVPILAGRQSSLQEKQILLFSTRRVASCRDARVCTRRRYPAMYSVTRSADIHTHTHLTLPSTFVIPTCYAHPSFQSLRRMEPDIRRRRASPLVIDLLSKPRTDVSLPQFPNISRTITSKLPNFQPRSTTSPASPRSVPHYSMILTLDRIPATDIHARPRTLHQIRVLTER